MHIGLEENTGEWGSGENYRCYTKTFIHCKQYNRKKKRKKKKEGLESFACVGGVLFLPGIS